MFNTKQYQIPGAKNKMPKKSPVIQFSPFEALLIGEKNKILKREPMKNTIFVRRLKHRNRTFNLRDLFDLENDCSKSENQDVIFKMPQRVRDFLKTRKLKSDCKNKQEAEDILYFDFKGQKMIVKNNDQKKTQANMKFKKKFKNNFDIKVIRKLLKHKKRIKSTRNIRRKGSGFVIKDLESKQCIKRHLLRGKDGKFISRKEYQDLKLQEISTKQKYLTNYLHQLYLKRSSLFSSKGTLDKNENLNEIQAQLSIENFVKVPQSHKQFDITAPEALLNDISEKYYNCNCQENFQFPKFPDLIKLTDFDDDKNLLDIVYENFPKVKFHSEDIFYDFSDVLKNAQILSPEKTIKMYEKKKSVFFNSEKLTVIFNNHIPFVKLRKLDSSKSVSYPYKNGRNGFTALIDEPCTKKNHLITTKSFECIFFRNSEGKEIFLGNLRKPFWHNSWFGRLPEV